ncbi:MAG TPA: ABC transporter ATP-binding protein [Acidimicrobiales bacterium]|nr:ABC transporter ATP-binding protein [Acidimicrobiales bacterium]
MTGLELAVELVGVRRRYGEGAVAVDALRGVDLSIRSGEFVVLLGPSGSGKTTLLNIVGGIDSATDGTVRVAGHDLAGLDADALAEFRRTCVGFVFQFFNLIPTLTARENVALIAELVERSDRSADLLRAVGLGDRLDHFPAALSGGEQQRVAVARALAKEPQVLLCDEPTGALDLDTGRQVLSLLRHVNREEGRTVIVVTHNQVIARMADRVVRLHGGSISGDEAIIDPLGAEALEW